MKTVGERKIISLIEEEIIYKQVCDGEDVEKTEPSINGCLKFRIFRFVHPFKDRHHKNRYPKGHYDNFIDQGDFQVTVHAVVQWGESATSNQDADSCVIESIENCVGL
jgi:hypothetical protein